MKLFSVPIKMFEIEIKGEKLKKFLDNSLSDITEVEIRRKDEEASGYIIGTKDNDIILRSNKKLENGKKYEIRFTTDRGIIKFEANSKGEIEGSKPPLILLECPKSLMICERRRYMRIRVPKSSEVIIKRDNGYALFCMLSDISLGGFSVSMNIKDKMIEYFLPMLNEDVGFSMKIVNNKKIDLEGRAVLKHYSLGSDGKYKAGFNFSKVDKEKLKKLISFLTKKEKKK
jgi:c-di-GMP-binding flagellar brake protein YcgR